MKIFTMVKNATVYEIIVDDTTANIEKIMNGKSVDIKCITIEEARVIWKDLTNKGYATVTTTQSGYQGRSGEDSTIVCAPYIPIYFTPEEEKTYRQMYLGEFK